MAKLSSPESVLAKIGEVEDRIIDLFEAVDHITKIESDLSSLSDKAQGQAVQLDGLIGLGKDRAREIDGYCESAKKTVDELKGYYENVKVRIDWAIELITSGKEEMTALLKRVNEAINSLLGFKELTKGDIDRARFESEGKVGNFIAEAEARIPILISGGIEKAEQKVSETVGKKIAEFISRQNALLDNLNKTIDAMQGLVSGLRMRLDQAEINVKKVAGAVSNHKAHIHQMIQKLNQQEEMASKFHGRIDGMERRLEEAEKTIKEMAQRKRGFWAFGRKV
jgi:chromosome segregation ATPase